MTKKSLSSPQPPKHTPKHSTRLGSLHNTAESFTGIKRQINHFIVQSQLIITVWSTAVTHTSIPHKPHNRGENPTKVCPDHRIVLTKSSPDLNRGENPTKNSPDHRIVLTKNSPDHSKGSFTTPIDKGTTYKLVPHLDMEFSYKSTLQLLLSYKLKPTRDPQTSVAFRQKVIDRDLAKKMGKCKR